jgi:hypothetical protein
VDPFPDPLLFFLVVPGIEPGPDFKFDTEISLKKKETEN